LDALVVNRSSDVMVVALHGATDRAKTTLPRFEWLRTLLDFNVSCVFFSDPALHLSERIQLAWYTGWDGVDCHAEIANETRRIASFLGVERVVFTGASGGGFAALQSSALVDESLVLAFNAQTDIPGYRVNGQSWGVQRTYLQYVWPKIWASFEEPQEFMTGEWRKEVGDRISAVERYSVPRRNHVHIVQNADEFHYGDHFLPFLRAARTAGNDVVAHTNNEGALHNPPRLTTFQRHLRSVLEGVAD